MDQDLLEYLLRKLKENCILVKHTQRYEFTLFLEDGGPYGSICSLSEDQFDMLIEDGWKVHD